MGDRYRKLSYPKPRIAPDAPFEEERYNPQVGKYYKVRKNNGRILEGYLDHVATMRTGAVLGFLYDPEGNAVGGVAISTYATWMRLEEQ